MTEYFEWFDVAEGHNGLVNTGSTTATCVSKELDTLDSFTSNIDNWTVSGASGTDVIIRWASGGYMELHSYIGGTYRCSSTSNFFNPTNLKETMVSIKQNDSGVKGKNLWMGFGLVKDNNNWIGMCGYEGTNSPKIAKCIGGGISIIGNIAFTEIVSNFKNIYVSVEGSSITFSDDYGHTETVDLPNELTMSEMKWGFFNATQHGETANGQMLCDYFKGYSDVGYYIGGDVITNKIVDAGSDVNKFGVALIGNYDDSYFYSKNGVDWVEITSDKEFVGNSTDPVDLYLKFSVGANSKFKGFVLSVK